MVKTQDKDDFEALKNGSQAAFKKIYNENRELFINFGRRYKLDDEDLTDIYQDSYVALYENIMNGKLNEMRSSISTYLISIGKYKIMERLRKNKKVVKSDFIMNNVSEVDDSIRKWELDDSEMSEQEKRLKVCFDQLGLKCQEVLKLFYYRGFSIKEIMKTASYNSENVVKSQKSRCLKQLRLCVTG